VKPSRRRAATHVTACAFAFAFASGLVPGPAAARGDALSAQQAKIRDTQSRLSQKRHDLVSTQLREEHLRSQLAETERGISRVTASLGTLSAQVHGNERRIAWNQVQLGAAERTLALHDGALRRRLVDAYERGNVDYLNVLFSATSFSEFVERWDDIRFLVAANQRTVRDRREAERAVSGARRRLEGQRLTLDAAVAERQRARAQLAALDDQRTSLVAVADAQRVSVTQQVTELEETTAAEEAQLEALIRERQREEAVRRAAEDAARRRAAQLAGQELAPQPNQGAPGTFSWPASGPITSPFGMRTNPVEGGFRMHTGIDIGAPMGATITAAAAGRVIFAGVYGGYGNAIIIDHGGSTSTLYGHCSQLFVSQGQDVQRGQAIGAVGSTGHSTGPHLHFEVRVDGQPVDPTSRLR